jgi:hypothetical protein
MNAVSPRIGQVAVNDATRQSIKILIDHLPPEAEVPQVSLETLVALPSVNDKANNPIPVLPVEVFVDWLPTGAVNGETTLLKLNTPIDQGRLDRQR